MTGLLLAWLLAPVDAASPFAERLNGRWVAAEPAPVLEARFQAALDRTVDALPWVFRAVARPRLEANVGWCRTWSLSLDAAKLALRCDDEPPEVLPLDRPGRALDDEGEPMQVRVRVAPPAVTVITASDKAVDERSWRVEEGGGLVVRRRISSPSLPVPFEWHGRYRRATAP